MSKKKRLIGPNGPISNTSTSSNQKRGGSGSLGQNGPRFRLMPKLRQLARHAPELAQEFVQSWNLVKLLILLEVLLNYLIIKNVKYTEIDWSTYMAQVGQVFNSSGSYNLDYSQIEGPTGPLVYPAGHLYVFYLFKELTDQGTNIQTAQYLYLCIYIAQLILVYKIYSHKRTLKVPPYVFIVMCFTSYRIHSIYVLRLFNDPVAILAAYTSFYLLLKKYHGLSAIMFSLAISIKMNILLFAPAYALIYYEDLGLLRSIKYGLMALVTQIALAAPFIYTNPMGYFNRAYDFGRVFLYKWTVNWKVIDEANFTSPQFFKLLLGLHVLILFLIFFTRWLNVILPKRLSFSHRRDDPIVTLFISNFIGMAFSRSLHYQFYVWYYHSLPLILWATNYSVMVKMLLLGLIEYSWNQYPANKFSSFLLHASHFLILIGLFTRNYFKSTSQLDPHQFSKNKKKRRRRIIST